MQKPFLKEKPYNHKVGVLNRAKQVLQSSHVIIRKQLQLNFRRKLAFLNGGCIQQLQVLSSQGAEALILLMSLQKLGKKPRFRCKLTCLLYRLGFELPFNVSRTIWHNLIASINSFERILHFLSTSTQWPSPLFVVESYGLLKELMSCYSNKCSHLKVAQRGG